MLKAIWPLEDLVSALQPCEKRHFWSHLCIKTIILPRQARDQHRENSKKDAGQQQPRSFLLLSFM
jgi:hypothetical protein